MKSATPMTKRLAIIGGGVTKDAAPYADTSWDIWTTASIARGLPRVTMVWEIHTDAHVKPDTKLDWECPVMLQHERSDTPAGVPWNPDKLIAKYGRHFSGSMCYMLGEAVAQGYTEIVTYGVDMQEAEYAGRMREDFIYLVGLFTGMGVKITVSNGTPMLWDSPAYEYEAPDGLIGFFKGRLKYAEDMLSVKQDDKIRIIAEAEYVRGIRDGFAQVLQFMGA